VSKSETYEKGAATRRAVMGDAMADKMAKSVYTGPVMETFSEYATEAVFGMLWSRPGLEIYFRFALNLGWTEEELTEALLHLGGYIGVPSVREAMIIADRVFREVREGGD